MKNLFILLLLICTLSCTSRRAAERAVQQPVILEKIITQKQIQRDTVIVSKADSTFYKALIECQNGKPIIINSQLKEGKNLQSSFQLNGNALTVKTVKKQEDIPVMVVEKVRTETIPRIIYKDKPYPVEKPLSFWQKTQIWAGRIFLGLISLGVLVFVMKRRIP